MNEFSLGLFLIALSIAVLLGLAIVIFKGSTLSTRISTELAPSDRVDDLITGTEAVVSKTLRPVGTIEHDSIPFDATSEGEFIEAGTRVVVIGRLGKSVLVRRQKQL